MFTIQLIGCYRSKKAYDMGYSINTNQHTPFASIENEKLIVEICDSLSIGFADEAPAKRPRKPLEEIVEYRQVKPVFKEDTDL